MTGISGLLSSQEATVQSRALAAFSNAATHASDATSSSGTGSTDTSATANSSTQLNANSFITLLAAQLQAQDPLNPMDPNQMMGELISLNSLQQLINIQQDLSGKGSPPVNGGVTGTGAANPTGSATLGAAQPATQLGPSPSNHDVVVQKNLYPAQAPASSY